MDIRVSLGRNVRKLREAQGWSQEDYADRAGIHRTYVSDIERGRPNPTITVVAKLAKPLGVTAGICWIDWYNRFIRNHRQCSLRSESRPIIARRFKI